MQTNEAPFFLLLDLDNYGSYEFKVEKALKHTYQLRGMASTVHMRTTTSPGQWQPRTAVYAVQWRHSLPDSDFDWLIA